MSAEELTAIKAEMEKKLFLGWQFSQDYHKNDRGVPLTFDRWPFLITIYKDDHPYQIFQKSTQCGITERTFCYVMSKLYQGWNVMYAWPGQTSRTTFSKRFDRQVSFSEFYQKGLEAAPTRSDSAILKYFWQGQLKLVGSNTLAELKEFPADMVIVEEFDLCNPGNIGAVYHRMDNSQYKYRVLIGNPTVEGEGICAEYNQSDQRVWHIKCPHCNKWQSLDWFQNVVHENSGTWKLIDAEWKSTSESGRDIHVFCKHCKRPLDRYSSGHWVPARPDIDIHGYHISQLFSGTVSVAEMWDHFVAGRRDNTKLQLFYNNRLGLGYEGAGAKVSHGLLNALRSDYIPLTPIGATAGIDTGANCCHVVISDYSRVNAGHVVKRIKWAGTTALNLDEVDGLLRQHGVQCAVVDAHPETLFVRELKDRLWGGIWSCVYRKPDMNEDKIDEESYTITVNRTAAIDRMVGQLTESSNAAKNGEPRLVLIPDNAPSIDDGNFYKQMCAPTRKFDRDRGERGQWIWDEGSKPDHYFHAMNYDFIAADLRPGEIKIVSVGNRDMNPNSMDGY